MEESPVLPRARGGRSSARVGEAPPAALTAAAGRLAVEGRSWEGGDDGWAGFVERWREVLPRGAREVADWPGLVETLVQAGVDRGEVLRAAAEALQARAWLNAPENLPHELRAKLPLSLAVHYGLVPCREDGGQLEVAALDPFSRAGIAAAERQLRQPLRLVIVDPRTVSAWAGKYLVRREPPAGTGGAGRDVTEVESLANEPEQPPVVRLVNTVLRQAIADGASDIHFEPFEREVKIRYRIDGALYEMSPAARELAAPIASRLKVLAHLDIAERRRAQDGRILATVEGRRVDLRLSTLPTQFGESVVLRVLDAGAIQRGLGDLGLSPPVLRDLEQALRRPHGLLVVTGPTGSGKTTTLYALLRRLNEVKRKVLTAEDPVEYELEGVMQVSVNPAAGLTFARALRAFLRQDPDVVMVGELRDEETARVAVQAALTGHLVLTTLHTPDAAAAVARLCDLGIEPYLVASTLTGVVAQRLVRRVCPQCGGSRRGTDVRPYSPGADDAGGDRCPACRGTGWRGRSGLFEWLPIDDEIRALISRGGTALEVRARVRARGHVSLGMAGAQLIENGITTAAEVARHCGVG